MNAYEKAQSLGLTGTDQQIVDQLQPLTVTPISITYLMELLNFRGMLRKTDGQNGDERWKGTLQNLKAYLVASELTEFVDAYELWFSHVTNPRQTNWDTSVPAFATAFAQMEASFAGQPGMPSVEDFQAVIALGGGRPFASMTPEQFDADRNTSLAAKAARQAFEAIRNRRQAWDTLAADIRSQIESGQLADNAAVIAAVTTGL